MFTFLWAQVLELGFYLPEPNVAILAFSFRKFEFLRRAIKFLLSHFERYLCICQASKHYWCWRRRCLFADIWESHPLEAAYWHMRIIYLNTVTITNSQFDTPRECLIEMKPLNNILFCQNKSRNICSNAFHSLNTFSNWLLNMWRNQKENLIFQTANKASNIFEILSRNTPPTKIIQWCKEQKKTSTSNWTKENKFNIKNRMEIYSFSAKYSLICTWHGYEMDGGSASCVESKH